MSEPFNLDAVISETDREPFRFTFGGEQYECPPGLDLRVVTAMGEGRLADAMRTMLGAAQWERMQASPAVLDVERFTALFTAYSNHVGATPGESEASTDS